MTTLIFTFILMLLVMLGMSIGVILANKPVKGSCGGLNQINGLVECELCGSNKSQCREVNQSG